MSSTCKRRLLMDYQKINGCEEDGISAAPLEDNIMEWDAVIFGPKDSIWEDGTFKLKLKFSDEYPTKPPKVKFLTKMFHPNIYNDGRICLDILQNHWSPTYDVASILRSIQSLLTDPNPKSPANNEAARLFTMDRKLYEKKVSKFVEDTWGEEGDDSDE